MRLRQFHGVRMPEAMAAVRAALGEHAVILGSRRVAGGVEVTAALEAPEPELILPDTPAPDAVGPLAKHGVPAALAARLARGTPAAALAAVLAFAALPDGVARPLLLAGPPGAGKTTTCAKLATRLVLDGGQPLVVTSDGARAGAAEQLAAYTRVLGLPLAIAPEGGTLVKAVARRTVGQPVLIDTAGCDPFDPEGARALLALARAVEAEMVLVLPPGLDPAEASEIARGFALLGARHLLPVRLDRARRLGGVLAAAAAGLALTEAGVGACVIEGLVPITPEWLARRLLAPPRGQGEAGG